MMEMLPSDRLWRVTGRDAFGYFACGMVDRNGDVIIAAPKIRRLVLHTYIRFAINVCRARGWKVERVIIPPVSVDRPTS